jgi:hypothetical protein
LEGLAGSRAWSSPSPARRRWWRSGRGVDIPGPEELRRADDIRDNSSWRPFMLFASCFAIYDFELDFCCLFSFLVVIFLEYGPNLHLNHRLLYGTVLNHGTAL